jgi:hypothetical protein
LIEATITLANAGSFIKTRAVARIIPTTTLADELQLLSGGNNPWLAKKVFRSALTKLEDALPKLASPLVLTNGDYQPGNFLAHAGKLSGFLDFESASFQDPMMGFVKYPIYDLRPLSRTDLISIFLREQGFSEREFRWRLAIGCLRTLNREITVSGGGKEMRSYRNRVLGILHNATVETSLPPAHHHHY